MTTGSTENGVQSPPSERYSSGTCSMPLRRVRLQIVTVDLDCVHTSAEHDVRARRLSLLGDALEQLVAASRHDVDPYARPLLKFAHDGPHSSACARCRPPGARPRAGRDSSASPGCSPQADNSASASARHNANRLFQTPPPGFNVISTNYSTKPPAVSSVFTKISVSYKKAQFCPLLFHSK